MPFAATHPAGEHLDRLGLGVDPRDLAVPIVACVNATVPIDRDAQHRATGRAELLDLAIERHAVELAPFATRVHVAVDRVPRDAFRMVEAFGEHLEAVDHAAPSIAASSSSMTP
jgi:hypothetical protein